MVTFATQKTRIASEMVRNDIASGGARETLLEQHYQDAVEHYANEKFWFNSIRTTVNTVADTATVPIPLTVRRVERVRLDAYERELREVGINELPDDSDVTGIPTVYCYYNDSLRLHPVPDAIYTLTLYGVSKVAAPTIGADDNIWTNEAAPLIRAHTKMTLARGLYRDPEGTQFALAEVKDTYDRIRRETAKRLITPIRAFPAAAPFNINIG